MFWKSKNSVKLKLTLQHQKEIKCITNKIRRKWKILFWQQQLLFAQLLEFTLKISTELRPNVIQPLHWVRYQQGYTRKDGTYVQGHYKTSTNTTNHDNFSTSGNLNTFTGTIGTHARDYSSNAYNYGSGRTIHTGSRGGQYYINSKGNKTYVPKRR